MSTVYCERGWPLSLMRVVLYIIFYVNIVFTLKYKLKPCVNIIHQLILGMCTHVAVFSWEMWVTSDDLI